MNVVFDSQGSVDFLASGLREMEANPAVQGTLVLACDSNQWIPDDIDPILTAMSKPVVGGIFPQIIYDRMNHEKGTLLIGLPVKPEVAVVPGLSAPDADYTEALTPYANEWTSENTNQPDTLLVFVDGLSSRIAALVESLFFCFGLEQNFIGGGAGSLSFKPKPCLLTPSGLLGDAALVARLSIPSGIGVSHGWEPISDSMKVTAAKQNVIQSLDSRPAYEVYRELVEAHSGWTFKADNFFDIAKCYPFGINKMGGEVVVRDPLQVDDNQGLICVGEVPQNSFVRLLNGTPESLIGAAARARELAVESAPTPDINLLTGFFIDCISRVLFLGDRITDELNTAGGGAPLFGALTLGEIANNGRDYLEFYNKTSVIALLKG